MKKRGILLGIVCLLTLFITTGCMNKKAITTSEFKSKMDNKGFTITDVKEQYAQYDYVEEATIASNGNYQIEFYKISNVDKANGMFNTNKKIFKESKGNGAIETTNKMGNYENYSLTSGGYYMYLCRVDNTLIYIKVNTTYKDSVINIIKDLGY